VKNIPNPSSNLTTAEIRLLIDRMRGAHIATSVNDHPDWPVIANIIHELQVLYKRRTGRQH
jgi:hypothetical protein